MRRFIKQGSEPEKVACSRLVYDQLLLIFVDDRDSDGTRDQDIAAPARIGHLIDTLAGLVIPQFHLSGEHRGFFIVQERKEWDLSQYVYIAGHLGCPR